MIKYNLLLIQAAIQLFVYEMPNIIYHEIVFSYYFLCTNKTHDGPKLGLAIQKYGSFYSWLNVTQRIYKT
jgi:hypothetical protein